MKRLSVLLICSIALSMSAGCGEGGNPVNPVTQQKDGSSGSGWGKFEYTPDGGRTITMQAGAGAQLSNDTATISMTGRSSDGNTADLYIALSQPRPGIHYLKGEDPGNRLGIELMNRGVYYISLDGTVTITSATTARIIGTFSATFMNNSTGELSYVSGGFDAPVRQ